MEFALQSTRKLRDLAYKISRFALLIQRRILHTFQESQSKYFQFRETQIKRINLI